MKKTIISLFLLVITCNVFAQKDSLNIGDPYLEDQLYVLATYNVLTKQPSGVEKSGFSYGFSTGFIKDIPFNKKKTLGIGTGVGYGFDFFNHGLKTVENNNQITFQVDDAITQNRLRLHNIEFPIELRWRNSTAKKYNFWRLYAGVKVTYNLHNKFSYIINNQAYTFNNIDAFNKWQTGFIFSGGYAAFNFHFYYGLSPMLKNASVGTTKIDTRVMKFGLTFYIL